MIQEETQRVADLAEQLSEALMTATICADEIRAILRTELDGRASVRWRQSRDGKHRNPRNRKKGHDGANNYTVTTLKSDIAEATQAKESYVRERVPRPPIAGSASPHVANWAIYASVQARRGWNPEIGIMMPSRLEAGVIAVARFREQRKFPLLVRNP